MSQNSRKGSGFFFSGSAISSFVKSVFRIVHWCCCTQRPLHLKTRCSENSRNLYSSFPEQGRQCLSGVVVRAGGSAGAGRGKARGGEEEKRVLPGVGGAEQGAANTCLRVDTGGPGPSCQVLCVPLPESSNSSLLILRNLCLWNDFSHC